MSSGGQDRLKRVIMRLRHSKPKDRRSVFRKDLEVAIIKECGYSYPTYASVKRALLKLGWLEKNKRRFYLTDKDLMDEF